MAVNSMDQLKAGDKVMVEGFEGTVVVTSASDDTIVRVSEPVGLHFVALSQLTKAVPYKNGIQYIDDTGVIYTFTSDGAGGGSWRNRSGLERSYSTPARPLREVTFGPGLED